MRLSSSCLSLLRQVGEQVGRIVRAHLLEDVGRGLGWQGFQDVDLVFGGELLHHVRGSLVVECGENPGPIARRQLLDDMGDVGRVEGLERLVRDAQLEAS